MGRSTLHTWLALLPLLLWGCVGTPQPDPPNLDPHLVDLGTERGGEVTLIGSPGAVTPAGATLHITNLDSDLPPVVVAPAPDGSFSTAIPGAADDELRMQVRHEDRRSIPRDVLVLEDGLQLAVRPLADCFTTEPHLELAAPLSGTVDVTLVNDCDEALEISRVEPRTAGSGLSVIAAPGEVPPGSSATVTLELSPPWSEGSEEILLIEVAAPEPDRRPITFSAEEG